MKPGFPGPKPAGAQLLYVFTASDTVGEVTALKDLDALARRFTRLKYTTKLVKKTRRATLRVSGQGYDRDGVECEYLLVLELEFDGKSWHPLGITKGDWESARSWITTTSGTLVARRPVVDATSLEWAFEQLSRRKPQPVTAASLDAL